MSTAWQSEMDKQQQNFSMLFELLTTGLLEQEYNHFGDPIPGRIVAMFRDFTSGDLEPADAVVSRLSDTNMKLGREYEKLLGDAEDYLDEWEGDAATNARSWMRGMNSALARQRELIDALIMVHKSQRAVIEKFRADVLALIDATNKALKTAGEEARKLDLAIIGAVAGVVGAFTAGVGAPLVIAVGAAMVSGAASIASASIGGHNQAQVIVSMVMAGEDIIRAAGKEMEKVEAGFKEITRYLSGPELKWVRPDRPSVVTDGGFNPDGFHPEDGYTPQVRDRLPKTDVLPEPPKDEDRSSDHGPWGNEEDVYPEQLRSTS